MTRAHTAVLLVLLTTFLLLAGASVFRATPTRDEYLHYKYGEKILQLDPKRDEALYDSKMPISALNAIPWEVVKVAGWDSWITDLAIKRFAGPDRDPETARKVTKYVPLLPGKVVTMFFGVMLAGLVFQWARELYGIESGLVALAFYVFSPNILANANLVTVDLYAALVVTLALYLYWKFWNLGATKWTGLSALSLGIAQLAKYTCLLLYPIFLLIAAIRTLINGLQAKDWRTRLSPQRLRRALATSLLFILLSLAVINVGFVFFHTFTPLEQYRFRSSRIRAVQDRLSFLGFLPVPLPYPYFDGIDYVAYHEETGSTFPQIYLLGKLAPRGHGFPGYYFVATLYKTPLAAQFIFWMALVMYLANVHREDFARNELFLLLPIAFFTIYFNFFFRAQIGMRFFIVVLPLCHVFLSYPFRNWDRIGKSRKIAVGILLGYQMVSVLSYCPHFLSYFNELVPDRKMAYQILADSNLDWGQSQWYLSRYRALHPEAVFEPPSPVAGKIVVSVNDVVGLGDPDAYRWLRENFKPTATIAYSYLVYEVSPEALAQVLQRHP
jgi:hypothetical protein